MGDEVLILLGWGGRGIAMAHCSRGTGIRTYIKKEKAYNTHASLLSFTKYNATLESMLRCAYCEIQKSGAGSSSSLSVSDFGSVLRVEELCCDRCADLELEEDAAGNGVISSGG